MSTHKRYKRGDLVDLSLLRHGDIVDAMSDIAKKRKFHLCVRVAEEGLPPAFVLMNTGWPPPKNEQRLFVGCKIVPIKRSKSGKSEFDCSKTVDIIESHSGDVKYCARVGDLLAALLFEHWNLPVVRFAHDAGDSQDFMDALVPIAGRRLPELQQKRRGVPRVVTLRPKPIA